MKNYFFALFLFLFALSLGAQAQAPAAYQHRPFQLTLITPLGTNGIESAQTVNHVSINLFGGVAAGVEGVELGGFANVNRDYMHGGQAAGFVNVVGNEVRGGQVAGFANVNGGSLYGLQYAGFMNINQGPVKALQGAGFMNINGDSATVLQGAGFMNINQKATVGVQAAGFMNIAGGNFTGVQAAGFANLAQDVTGVQVSGFLNVAHQLNGLQLGFLNLADTVERGVPIGFLSLVKKGGYRQFEIAGGDALHAQASFRTGVPAFYNIFAIGWRFQPDQASWGVGYGIGTEWAVGQKGAFVNGEALTWHINESTNDWTTQLNSLTQLKLLGGYRVSPQVALFAGPTLNILVSDVHDIDSPNNLVPERVFYDRKFNGGTSLFMWPGFNAGVRF